MSSILIDNFSYKGKKPLDDRKLFVTIAEMKAYPESQLPKLFDAFCEEDGKKYVFNKDNSVDETTGKWREFKSGTGTGADGKDGKSAYQIAKEKGFDGTEAEWLASLKGTNGTNGTDGITPTLAIGTVTTLDAGTNATATITGVGPDYNLNLGIPKGADGEGSSVDLTPYQPKTDNSLNTTAKTVVGAINEIKGNVASGVTDEQVATAVTNYLADNPVSAEVTNDSVSLDSIQKNTLFAKSMTITENTNQNYKAIKLATPIKEAGKVIKVTAEITMNAQLDLILGAYSSKSDSRSASSSAIRFKQGILNKAEFTITTQNLEVSYLGLYKQYSDQSNVGTIKNIKVYVNGNIIAYTLENPTTGNVIIEDDNEYLANLKTVEDEADRVNEKLKSISLDSVKNNVFAKDFEVTTEVPTSFKSIIKFDKQLAKDSVVRIKGIVEYNVSAQAQLVFSTDSTTTGNGSVRVNLMQAFTKVPFDVEFNSLGEANAITLKKIGGTTLGIKFKEAEVYVDGVIVGVSIIKDYITEGTKTCTIASKDYADNKISESASLIKRMANKEYHIVSTNTDENTVSELFFDKYIPLKKDDVVTLTGRIRPVNRMLYNVSIRVEFDNSYLVTGDLRDTVRDEFTRQLINKPHTFSCRQIISKDTDFIQKLTIRSLGLVEFYLYDLIVFVNGKPYIPNKLVNVNSQSEEVSNENVTFATKDYVDMKTEGCVKTDYSIPFVNTLYTVGVSANDREFALPVFVDYCYGGFKEVTAETKVLFKGNSVGMIPSQMPDRTYLFGKRDSSIKINNNKKEVELYSKAYNVAPLKFNHVVVDESIANGKIHLLTIGDSVTAGAVTKKQYWRFCAEYFAQEDLALNKKSDVLMLGSNNCGTSEVTYGEKNKTVTAAACGISSWSLNSWLTNVSTTTDYSNPGGLNGFTYTDDNGKTQFSILKWVERFRNYTDEGTKLELGDEKLGSWITADNIDKVQCCTPTHLYINSTHNGGTIEEHMKIIQIAQQEIPGIKIIVGSPMPLLGSWNIDLYENDWVFNGYVDGPNYSGQQCGNRHDYMKYWTKAEREKSLSNYYYFPQNVITPTIEAYEYTEIDAGFKKMKKITNQPMPKEHPGTYCHKIWGYELYALLKYIAAENTENITTNVVSVTLDVAEKALTVGGTHTLTATPSTSGTAVTFSSTDESVATVSSDGVITATGVGECFIYAETATSILPTTCKVTVTE